MPSALSDSPSAIPTVRNEQLLRRIMGEFDEMPSLRLTTPQAMRLWGLDCATCEEVLEILIEARFLQRDRWGQFARTHADY